MEKFLNSITPTEISEVYNLLEEIMEALGDGRKPEESTAQFRDRKANELIKHFSDKKAKAEDEEKIAHQQAEYAKKEFHKNPNTETGQKMLDATFNASDKVFKTSDASRKEAKAKNIKNKIEWRKNMSEALELMEELLFELDLETKQNISPNKVKRLKKNKDGETVKVVSVADELFPADGDAKKQYDRKILDKINDMIEGTGTLEDLIQLVKRGIPSRK